MATAQCKDDAPLVVLVNNEAAILNFMRQALEERGLRVAAFAKASVALDAPELLEASMVVTDKTNPPLGGLGLWQAMRERGMTTPVAFMSAWAEDVKDMFRGAADQPVGYFQLPVRFSDVADRIAAYVDRPPHR